MFDVHRGVEVLGPCSDATGGGHKPETTSWDQGQEVGLGIRVKTTDRSWDQVYRVRTRDTMSEDQGYNS